MLPLLYELRKELDAILLDAINESDDLEELLDRVLKRATRWLVLELDWPVGRTALLSRFGSGRDVLASVGMSEGMREVSRTIVEKTLATGETQSSESVARDPGLSTVLSLVQQGTGSFVSVPIHGSGGLAGVLYLDSRESLLLEEELAQAVRELAATIAPYLETIARHHASIRRVKRAGRTQRRSDFIAEAPAMGEVLDSVARYALLDVPVLIEGETGVGKECVAQALHDGRDPALAFHKIELHARDANTITSELFGHEKGSFTGADSARAGIFEAAGRGTVLLDEIGDLQSGLQIKLLRVLQNKTVRRIGADAERKIGARIIAATNRSLAAEVAKGSFRSDLFFRIGAHLIEIPPLRERFEDLDELVRHFLDGAPERLGLAAPPVLEPGCLELLRGYDWPGNVRELGGFLERLAIRSNTRIIAIAECRGELDHWKHQRQALSNAPGAMPEQGLEAEMRRHETAIIRRALARHGGVKTAAARALRIPESTLRSKMGALGIQSAAHSYVT